MPGRGVPDVAAPTRVHPAPRPPHGRGAFFLLSCAVCFTEVQRREFDISALNLGVTFADYRRSIVEQSFVTHSRAFFAIHGTRLREWHALFPANVAPYNVPLVPGGQGGISSDEQPDPSRGHPSPDEAGSAADSRSVAEPPTWGP